MIGERGKIFLLPGGLTQNFKVGSRDEAYETNTEKLRNIKIKKTIQSKPLPVSTVKSSVTKKSSRSFGFPVENDCLKFNVLE